MRPRVKNVGLDRLCGLFGRTRQAWYESQKRAVETAYRDELILERVHEHRRQHSKLGGRKLHYLLNSQLEENGLSVGRDRLFRLLRSEGLLVKRKRSSCRTTDSNHFYRCHPNMVKDLEITRPNQVWASDMTYVRVHSGFVLLSLITDCYSKKIVGHALYPSLATEGPKMALEQALGTLIGPLDLIHHSDRGVQYCSNEYTARLRDKGIRISMGEVGNPYDNATAERVNGILKQEYGLDDSFPNYASARKQVEQAIQLYNNKRPHLSLGMHTPAMVHSTPALKFRKLWRSTRSGHLARPPVMPSPIYKPVKLFQD